MQKNKTKELDDTESEFDVMIASNMKSESAWDDTKLEKGDANNELFQSQMSNFNADGEALFMKQMTQFSKINEPFSRKSTLMEKEVDNTQMNIIQELDKNEELKNDN